MSLPAEIRLRIYELVLVKEVCVDFGRRKNFAHASGFLRVNKAVCAEGSAVLYGSNKFIFRPCRVMVRKYSTLWVTYLNNESCARLATTMRNSGPGLDGVESECLCVQSVSIPPEALKSAYQKRLSGSKNLSLLKSIAFDFCDAAPSDEPKTPTEYRRFQHNEDLLMSLRQLALHATGIEMLKLSFSGRARFWRNTSRATREFSDILSLFNADIVTIGEVVSTRIYYSALMDKFAWWTNRADRSRMYLERKIDDSEANHFINKITRKEPLNPGAVNKHLQNLAEAKTECSSPW